MSREAAVLAVAGLAALATPASATDLTGRVVSSHDGSPVAGAHVRVIRAGEFLLAGERKTDRDGDFRAPGLAKDRYVLHVSKTGYLSSRLFAESDGLTTVGLLELASISGRVIDSAGRPVAGAQVCARSEAEPPVPCKQGSPQAAATDRTGNYRLSGLLPGNYDVSAVIGATTGEIQGGFAAYAELVTLSHGQAVRNIDLALSSSTVYAVSGRLEGTSKGQQYVVALAPADRSHAAVAVGYAADGRFHLEGAPTGEYRLFASGPIRGRSSHGALLGPGSLYGEARVEVLEQDVRDLSVGLSQGIDVLVRLEDDSITGQFRCPEPARVRLRPLEDRAVTMPEYVRASGKGETMRNVAPGRYWLSAEELGDGCFANSKAVTIDAENRDLTMQLTSAGAIVGSLTRSGEPAAGLGVTIAPMSAVAPASDRLALTLRSDASGRFELPSLAPGVYQVIRAPDGGRSVQIEVEVIGGAVTEIDLPTRDD